MIRVPAVALIVLVGAYFVMRALATACTGGGCDAYIPISLLILAAAAVTGSAATVSARGSAWFG